MLSTITTAHTPPHIYTLFYLQFYTQLSHLWNTKWTSFLRTLHTQSSQFLKMTRYFKTPHRPYPLCNTMGHKSIQPPSKPRYWPERSINPTISTKYGNKHPLLNINLSCQHIVPQYFSSTPLQKLSTHYEVRRKILSLKPYFKWLQPQQTQDRSH